MEMAERPYTLSLLVKEIAQIERWKAEGKRVTGLMLYRHMVLSWLERDEGKHHLTPDHKQAVMEYCAAALWRRGAKFWTVGDLEQWLIGLLESRPDMAAHYRGIAPTAKNASASRTRRCRSTFSPATCGARWWKPGRRRGTSPG
jgi:hypothetical protein